MTLRELIRQLSAHDQLEEIATPISCDLELAARSRREFQKSNGGRALKFTDVEGFSGVVISNLCGNQQRTALLLGYQTLEDFSLRLGQLLHGERGSAAERLAKLVRRAEVPVLEEQSGLQTGDLSQLPAIRSWPGEKGHYLTFGLTLTRHPQTGEENLGLYRAQRLGARQLALNFSPTSGAAAHLAAAVACRQPLPVSLYLGADPALYWLAAAPLPPGVSELGLHAVLFGSGSTGSLSQPTAPTAEVVIEGELDPQATAVEGPFGNHTGSYVIREDCPVMNVTAVYHRDEPLVPVTVVGPPPSENIHLAAVNEILIKAMLQIDCPEIVDLWMPRETIFHGVTILSLRPTAAGISDLLSELWGEGPLSRAKLLVFVDQDINPRQAARVWWRCINRLDPQRIHQDRGRLAIDACGIDPATLVAE